MSDSSSLRSMIILGLLLSLVPFGFSQPLSARTPVEATDSTDIYVIQLRGDPVVTSAGIPRGSEKAGPGSDAKPDLNSPQAQAREAQIDAQQQQTIHSINRALGTRLTPVYSYAMGFNGMALELTEAQSRIVAKLPEVVAVEREQFYELTTDAGPTWIGADQIWDGSVTGVYAATILGANEVPPVSSPATGRGTFSFDPATSTLNYTIVITGNTAPFTAAHIHRGLPTENGGVVTALSASPTPGTYVGNVVLEAADVDRLRNDSLYVNFHTATNPGGEVRGNISGYKGEGVIVGVLDSGINMSHPSFAEVDGNGYSHLNPLGQGNFKGACDPNNLPSTENGNPSGYNPLINCNNKLIGAWTFAQTAPISDTEGNPSPNDEDGHGSHTASTAAGNVVKNVSVANASFAEISGVAPRANVIAYDVCGFLNNGNYSPNCPSTALLAAANQAIADGVDVINYSISGGASPWTDAMEIAFRNARAAGIVVATSAGNSGPTASTVAHVSPWLMSVAATTHNRTVQNALTNITSGGNALPDIIGLANSPALPTNTPIVYAGSFTTPVGGTQGQCDVPFPANTFSGQIVVCDRGVGGRVAKAQNVLAGGAGGYVLANNASSGNSLNGDTYPLPGVHITYNDGVALKAWMTANANPTAQISGATLNTNASNADFMAAFSSRGPTINTAANILKPDLAAPGVDILAAIATDGTAGADFGFISGTSMASPHAAGSAALLAGLYPNWTPGQVQSALMTTGLAPITKQDRVNPTTPFDSGAGRIRLTHAVMAGLVLDETNENFISANPAVGGDPSTLNIPSMANAACISSCSWTRTVRNTLAVPVEWTATTDRTNLTVEPVSFTIQPGETATFTATLNVEGLPTNGSYVFGRVTWSATDDLAPPASFPVAARPAISNIPSRLILTAPTGVVSDTYPIRTIAYSALETTVYGMSRGTITNISLPQGGSSATTVVVPSDTARLVAEIRETTSLDADVYIRRDDGDGVFELSDPLICASETAAALEYCNLTLPIAGTYFIDVVNFTASAEGVSDSVKLVSAVVPTASEGNFTVTATETSAGGTQDLLFELNLPTSELGDVWYAWFNLTATDGPTSLGSTLFDFRHELGAPDDLQATTGTNQSAAVETAFAEPLTVTVTDSGGNPLPGIEVSFSAPTEGATATLSAASATTDAEGLVSITATAGQIAGTYNVRATAGDESNPITVDFSLTNTAGPVSAIELAGGTPQSTIVGAAFANPLSVSVTDSFGNPVAGAAVSFSAPTEGATAVLSSAGTTTDAEGRATITATAGQIAGTYNVRATAGDEANPITVDFSLTNTAGPVSAIELAGGTPQSTIVGAAFANPLSVSVTDSFGNPVAGAAVSFSAPTEGATAVLSSASTTTDAEGRATITATAGQIVGSYNVRATAGDEANPITVDFSLTNTVGPVGSIGLAGGGFQSAVVGSAFTQPLVVEVTDSFNNPIQGIEVSFSAPTNGATAVLSSANATTDAQGRATITATAGSEAGTYVVSATITTTNGELKVEFALTNLEDPLPPPDEYFIYLPMVLNN